MSKQPTAKDQFDPGEPGAGISLQHQIQYWKIWQQTRSSSGWARMRADFLHRIVSNLQLDRPAILDFGCGNGWFCAELATYGEVTGIDLNEEAMQQAREKWPEITFIGGDLFSYEPQGVVFDLVVSQQVIAHVENQHEYISKTSRLLRPGGYLLLTTNNKFVMDRLGSSDWGSHRNQGHIENWLSRTALQRLVSPHFEIQQFYTLIPLGDGGILRLVNSARLNRAIGFFVGEERLQQLKQRAGLGYYLILLAKKKISE
jgi:SAM-dependent methyltransferase